MIRSIRSFIMYWSPKQIMWRRQTKLINKIARSRLENFFAEVDYGKEVTSDEISRLTHGDKNA